MMRGRGFAAAAALEKKPPAESGKERKRNGTSYYNVFDLAACNFLQNERKKYWHCCG
jgi:hypothetical protein